MSVWPELRPEAEEGLSEAFRGLPGSLATGGQRVKQLLKLAGVIDFVNDRFGEAANWLVLLACLISAGNAASRYLFSASSNAWLEVQWYMFAGMVLLGGPYTLKLNEHVRVDL